MKSQSSQTLLKKSRLAGSMISQTVETREKAAHSTAEGTWEVSAELAQFPGSDTFQNAALALAR